MAGTSGYAPPIVNDQYTFFGTADAHAGTSDQGALTLYYVACSGGSFPSGVCPSLTTPGILEICHSRFSNHIFKATRTVPIHWRQQAAPLQTTMLVFLLHRRAA